jgi:hypothetical protein
MYLSGALLAEQMEQTTLPHALQWCRRTINVKATWHIWHMVTRASGTHTGARSPTVVRSLGTGAEVSETLPPSAPVVNVALRSR